MAAKSRTRRKPAQKPPVRVKPRADSRRSNRGLHGRLENLQEQVDVVLPEVTARVAALEHLLLELKLCTMAELRQAREFVRIQEA